MTTLHSRKSIDRLPLRRAEIYGLQKLMKTLTKVLLILLVSYFVAAANGASLEVFLEIEGIRGDSKVDRHRDDIDVVSFKIGVLNTGTFATGGGGAAGKAEFTDLTVIKFIDSASVPLCLAAAQGDHFRSATLVVRNSERDPLPILTIVLNDVLISSVNDSASTTDPNGNLLESITLNWARITWTFTKRDQNGSLGTSISRSFDRRTGRGG
jgi:type VI secretion system secreted protein Hcp